MNPTIALKIGHREIFRVPLNKLKLPSSQIVNRSNSGNQQSSVDYRRYDIVPKFLADQNVQDLNKEIINRFTTKKSMLEKITQTFLNKYDANFTSDIMDLENDINNQYNAIEYAKNNDFNNFQSLIRLINESNKNITPEFKAFSHISLEDYKKLDFTQKNEILKNIANNKRHVAENTGVNMVSVITLNNNPRPNNNNNNYNPSNNPYSFSNVKNNIKNFVGMVKKNISPTKSKSLISKEKIELFKKSINNMDIPDDHVISYFDLGNPSVLFACEKYFRNSYGCDNLTLYFVYPNNKGAIKPHVFHFTDDFEKLIMAAQDDFISIDRPRIVTEGGKTLDLFRKHGYVGKLALKNKSKVMIYKS